MPAVGIRSFGSPCQSVAHLLNDPQLRSSSQLLQIQVPGQPVHLHGCSSTVSTCHMLFWTKLLDESAAVHDVIV